MLSKSWKQADLNVHITYFHKMTSGASYISSCFIFFVYLEISLWREVVIHEDPVGKLNVCALITFQIFITQQQLEVVVGIIAIKKRM